MNRILNFFKIVLSFTLFCFISCNGAINDEIITENLPSGKISGKVIFSNAEETQNDGIIVSLDKSDGLRTVAVSRAVNSRSINNVSRAIVSTEMTSNDGSYTFENLTPGVYTVYASSSFSKEKAVCTNVVVRSAETTTVETLNLTATGNISGNITLDNSTTGNIGFLVFVAGTSYMAMTDDSGNFTISDVPAGEGYQVVATKNGIIHLLDASVTVVAKKTVKLQSNNFTSTELDKNGKYGKDGTSIVWLGSFDSSDEIDNPEYLNAYFNMTDGCSYIYDGEKWTLLAKAGDKGDEGSTGLDGKSIVWKGELATAPESPELYWAYYNTETGCSYIWNGESWDLLAKAGIDGENGDNGKDGLDGKSIVWKGELSSAPIAPELYWAYYNTETGCSYIWNGATWDLLSKTGKDGNNGENGKDGLNGKSIVWKGELATAPESPELYWAYYNTETGCSYIWNGKSWELLSKAGKDGNNGENGKDGLDGKSIVWKGELSTPPDSPELYWAYYNTENGCSYIWNGTKWDLLSKAGIDGANGNDGINALEIGTILSTEEPTNQNVIITINLTNSELSKIGYVYSSSSLNFTSANAVLSSSRFVPITLDTDGKYKIIASVNGYYTIAAKDFNGYAVYTEEIISNTDKIAPANVGGLSVKYDKIAKSITVNWTNPTDSDFDYVSLNYTKDGSIAVSNKHIVGDTYTLEDVEIDGKEYVFTVHAVDKAGNASDTSETTIIPTEGASVQSIELSRYHLAYNDPDQTITAVAKLNNAILIDNDTIVKFQIKDSDGNVTNTIATVDRIAGTATATLNAPTKTSNTSTEGSTFTVLCKIGDESVDISKKTRFNVNSSVGYLLNIEQYSNNSFTNDKVQISKNNISSTTTEIIRIIGYNLDLLKPSIQLYNSLGIAYYTNPIEVNVSSVSWTATKGEVYQTLYTEIPVPCEDDCYTIKILVDGAVQEENSKILQVYDVPKFTSFDIPYVSSTKSGNAVTAKIIGKNFDAPNIDFGNFIAICSSKSSIVSTTSFTKRRDNVIYATFTIPDTVGEYEITVKYGLNSIKGTLKVLDFSNSSVGDVLLNDGTIIAYNSDINNFTDEQKQKAVGVMYGFNEYGIPAGYLGIHNSSTGIDSGNYSWGAEKWVAYDTSNSYTNFIDIECYPSNTGGGAANFSSFIGNTDGCDNWSYICSVDSVGTKKSEENYPAFYYVNNYSKVFGITGIYSERWYLPSLPELCYIFRNKIILNSVLEKLSGDLLYDGEYWSASYCSEDKYCSCLSWYVDMSSGAINYQYMFAKYKICCVLPFD